MVVATLPKPLLGVDTPRIGPPRPLRSLLAEYEAAAERLGMKLYPWQSVAGHYMTAVDAAGDWLYREVGVVVARQNGKTKLMVPRILMGLDRGESILHTAQNRDIPRKTFMREVVPAVLRTGDDYEIRKANGQEEIVAPGGGRYKIVAPNDSSRGETADLVIIDEVWHQRDQELMDAMVYTTAARPNAQIVYLSNAGDMNSVVLNELRDRGSKGIDPRLAYLEWSSAPERAIDDRDGWAEANPTLGHGGITEETIEGFLRSRPQTSFERESLCRPTMTSVDAIVTLDEWQSQQFTVDLDPKRPTLGVKMDVSGERASAVLAWQDGDKVALDVVADVTGSPIDTELLADELKKVVLRKRATLVGYDPFTDADIARHLRQSKPITGRDYGNATRKFIDLVRARQLRVHDENGILVKDLGVTVPRKSVGGSFIAVKSSPEVTNTAAEAAIRAVWFATVPRPSGRAQVYS
jgi:hypothetical protein